MLLQSSWEGIILLRKTMPFFLLVLLLLLAACGEKPQTTPQSTLDVELLNNIRDGILYSLNEDKIIYPTDEETAAVINQLKKDFPLIQDVESGPQEHPLLTFVMDTDDKQQLQIAILKGIDELILTYTKDIDNVSDKAYFNLQSAMLRKEIEQIHERFLAEHRDGEKETLVFRGESENWRAILTVENIEYWRKENNAITYDNETKQVFSLQYKGSNLEEVGEVSYTYTTDGNSGGGTEYLDAEGKATNWIEGRGSLIRENNIISVGVEWNAGKETFDMNLDK